MAAFEWPQCSNLAGRPLDTALLLNRRDFATQLRNSNKLKDDVGDGVPADIFLRILDNVDTIYKRVCERGSQQDALDTFKLFKVTSLAKDTLEDVDGDGTIEETTVNVPRDLKKHRKYHASRNATLHILDPQHWNLKEAEVDSRFKRDSDGLSLKDRPVQITLLPPAKIMLKADNVEGARMLRKIKPRNFCCGAYSRRYWSLDRELPN
ncbi:MAG: hypothetical protein Q9223_001509 [Gallowayella weberi]